MTSKLVQTIVCALLGVSGLSAIALGVTRGRRFGAGLAFGLGGLLLVLYAAGFWFTYTVARNADLAGMAEAAGKRSETTEFIRRVERASFPVAVIEPAALLLLALGFGAVARRAHAPRADTPLRGDALDDLAGNDLAEAEEV